MQSSVLNLVWMRVEYRWYRMFSKPRCLPSPIKAFLLKVIAAKNGSLGWGEILRHLGDPLSAEIRISNWKSASIATLHPFLPSEKKTNSKVLKLFYEDTHLHYMGTCLFTKTHLSKSL